MLQDVFGSFTGFMWILGALLEKLHGAYIELHLQVWG